MATRLLGYNLVFKIQDKLIAATTSNSFAVNFDKKESITKEDQGAKSSKITGYNFTFSASGFLEVNEAGEETSRIDKDALLDLALQMGEVPFVYGTGQPGSVQREGNVVISQYQEDTDSENEGTYSVNFDSVGALNRSTVPNA